MPFHLDHDTTLPVPASSLIAEVGVIAPHMVRRTADGSCEQTANAFLKNLIIWYADRVQEALGFKVIVNFRRGEGGVTSEIQPYLPTLVASDNRLQHAGC